jgi:hypothetical protein
MWRGLPIILAVIDTYIPTCVSSIPLQILNFVGFVGQQAAWPTVRAGRPRCPHGRRAERCARLPKSWLAPRRSVAPVQLSGFFAAKTRASPRFFAIALRPDRWAGRASRCRVTYALKRAGGGQGDPPQGRSVGAATQVDAASRAGSSRSRSWPDLAPSSRLVSPVAQI